MLLQIIDALFLVYMLMLLARVLSSWVPEIQGSRAMQFIAFYTDPYLNLFRSIIPPLGMIDISPMIAFLALSIVEKMVKWLVVWSI